MRVGSKLILIDVTFVCIMCLASHRIKFTYLDFHSQIQYIISNCFIESIVQLAIGFNYTSLLLNKSVNYLTVESISNAMAD